MTFHESVDALIAYLVQHKEGLGRTLRNGEIIQIEYHPKHKRYSLEPIPASDKK